MDKLKLSIVLVILSIFIIGFCLVCLTIANIKSIDRIDGLEERVFSLEKKSYTLFAKDYITQDITKDILALDQKDKPKCTDDDRKWLPIAIGESQSVTLHVALCFNNNEIK